MQRRGWRGHSSIATSSSTYPPAHERLGILARGRAEPPLPLQGGSSHSLYAVKGTSWG